MIIAAAIVLVIASIGQAIVTVINAKAAADDRKEAKVMRVKLQESADANEIKTDKIIEQGTEIKTSTDGNLSKVTANLGVALNEIEGLKTLIASMTESKRVVDTLALAPRKIRADDQPTKVLEKIKENTGEAVEVLKELKDNI